MAVKFSKVEKIRPGLKPVAWKSCAPAQPGLCPFQHQQLKELNIVPLRPPPLGVMVPGFGSGEGVMLLHGSRDQFMGGL